MNNTTREVLTHEDFVEYKISLYIWTYVSPIVLVIGTIASVLSICVLVRRTMRESSSMFFLTALAVADLLVLHTGLLRLWISSTFKVDVRNLSEPGCKIHAFLVYVTLDCSSWILTAVTVDRCIVFCAPLKGRTNATKVKAKTTCVCIAFIAAIFNCHLLWTVSLLSGRCTSVSYFTSVLWPWIDLFKNSIVPFFVIMVTNVLIIRQIIRTNKRISDQLKVVRFRTVSGGSESGNEARSRGSVRRLHVPSITAMLLAISLAFFILTSPLVIFKIVRQYKENAPLEEKVKLDLFRTIANILQYSNNALHFFLYCLSGPRFRKEFISIFGKRRSRITGDQSTFMM